MPHENFSQLFVITPPVFLSLFSKKYTDRGEQIGSKRLCSCQKVYESSSPGQAGPVSLYPVYRSLTSEMFDEMAILFSPLKRAITLSPYQQN